MKFVIVTQWVRERYLPQIPPDYGSASTWSVAKPACKASNGSTKPGVARLQALYRAPKFIKLWSIVIPLSSMRGKADSVLLLEGDSPVYVMAKCTGHHRGPRPVHVIIGVTRELGRAKLSPTL